MEKKPRMILALDVTDRKEALKIAEEVSGIRGRNKGGLSSDPCNRGLGIIRELAEFTPVIDDFKVADIPNTNRLICEQVFESRG
jgi:orotidine-5'-phosphate decarboxylase